MNSTLNAFFPNTQILYITIAIVASLLAFIAEFFKKQHKLFSNVLILISYFILAFFATFSGVGSDKEHYAYFFSVINKESTYSGLEPLFNLIIICFKKITNDPKAFLMTIAFLTITFTYVGILINKATIHIGFSVLIFVSLYYFQSYNLMRLYFAMSILLLFSFLLLRKKYFFFLIVSITCFFIHYSCIFMIITTLVIMILEKLKHKDFSSFDFLFISLIVFAVAFFGKNLAVLVLRFVPSLSSKYSVYLNSELSSFGFKWIFNIFPFLILFSLSKQTNNKNAIIIAASFFFVDLFLNVAGYFLSMVQRATALMSLAVIILLPLMFGYLRIEKKRYVNILGCRLSFKTIKLIIGVYFCLSFVFYLHDYLSLDEIDNYAFVWEVF